MADFSSDLAAIRSPDPVWLASAPPTDTEIGVRRTLRAGAGGFDLLGCIGKD